MIHATRTTVDLLARRFTTMRARNENPHLAIATRVSGILNYGQLKLYPYWDPLRGNPRFQKLAASPAPKEKQ